MNGGWVKCLGISVCSISSEKGDRAVLLSAWLMASIAAFGCSSLTFLDGIDLLSLDSFGLSLDSWEWSWWDDLPICSLTESWSWDDPLGVLLWRLPLISNSNCLIYLRRLSISRSWSLWCEPSGTYKIVLSPLDDAACESN